MADNQEKQAKRGSDPASSGRKFSMNNIFLVINLLLLGALGFQIFQITKVYSARSQKDVSEGRKIVINVKNNEVETLKLSDDEIGSLNPNLKAELEKKQAEEKAKENKAQAVDLGDEFIGPPAPTAEQIEANYGTANLSIIVTDLGKTKTGLALAGTLPKEVAFAFSPYGDDLQNKMKRTIADGRQVLLNIILEPSGFPLKDSGPLTILTSSDQAQNLMRFEKTIGTLEGYTGFLTNTSEVFTNNLEIATPILNKIKDEEKFFGYYRSAANSYLENEVKPMAVDIAIVDYLIDDDVSEKEILKKLNQAKSDIISKKRRVVIALRPYKISIDVLQQWLKENLGANVRIAPISYFVTNN